MYECVSEVVELHMMMHVCMLTWFEAERAHIQAVITYQYPSSTGSFLLTQSEVKGKKVRYIK